MSDESKVEEEIKQKKEEKNQTIDKPKEVTKKSNESKVSESDLKTESAPTSQPIESASTSSQTINSLAESEQSVITLESLKYLQILDQYVSGKHWDFDMEYNLNSFSGVLWSLVITFFIFYEITDKCWDHLYVLLWLSLMMSAITSIELTVVWILWYLSLIYKYINRSKICLSVISVHLFIGSLNLLMAIIGFGTNTCHQSGKLDPSLEHIVPVLYDVKTIAVIHCIIAINMFICAMLLAIKRNDFKFYVLWRKGLLNDYLVVEYDE